VHNQCIVDKCLLSQVSEKIASGAEVFILQPEAKSSCVAPISVLGIAFIHIGRIAFLDFGRRFPKRTPVGIGLAISIGMDTGSASSTERCVKPTGYPGKSIMAQFQRIYSFAITVITLPALGRTTSFSEQASTTCGIP